jgi:hypothetical protein
MESREMCLAEETGIVTGRGQSSCKTLRTDLGLQIDAIVMDAVRAR